MTKDDIDKIRSEGDLFTREDGNLYAYNNGKSIRIDIRSDLEKLQGKYNKLISIMVGKNECPEDSDHECPDSSPALSDPKSCIRCWDEYIDALASCEELFKRPIKVEEPEEPINKEEYERTVREARAIFKGIE